MTNFKTFADDELNLAKMTISLFDRIENTVREGKILDQSKLKGFAYDTCDSDNENYCMKGRIHCGKRRKCWLPTFSPFPTFSKGFLHRVIKSHDCVVNSYYPSQHFESNRQIIILESAYRSVCPDNSGVRFVWALPRRECY